MERLSTRIRRKSAGTELRTVADMLEAMAENDSIDELQLPSEVRQAARESERDDVPGLGLYGHEAVRRLALPVGMVLRDLGMDQAGEGGALAGSPRQGHAPSLRGFSVVADAGATVLQIDAGQNAPGMPTVDSPPVAGWAADEYGAVPESDAVFGLKTLGFKRLGVHFTATRRLLQQGGEATDRLLRAEIARTIGRGIDAGVLGGTGADGQPLGLQGITGLASQSGTALAWAGIQNLLEAVALGGARDEAVQVVAHPGVRKLLAQRLKPGDCGLIWDAGQVDGKRARVSLEAPAGSLFLGDFRQVVVSLHGPVELLIDRRKLAYTGKVQVVAMVEAAVQVAYPGALGRALSVT
jgi:hypothetical protein